MGNDKSSLNVRKNDWLILIAGFGSAGRRHFRNMQILEYSNFIFYRSHKSTLSDNEIANCPAFADLEETLARHPYIAIVSNPTALHLSVAIPAAQAGCHLFIEKPLSHTLENCNELKNIAKKRQLVTMIGCQFRFHPLLISLRRQLKEARIGKVIGARAEYGEYLPDWHPWEDHRKSYGALNKLGGGTILTFIHPLDYLCWIFGEVDRVHATTARIPSLGTDVDDDLAEITLEFKSGVVGQVHLDYIQRPPVHTLTVWGDNGQAKWDFHAGTLEWKSVDGKVDIEKVQDGFSRNTMFIDEMRHFLECIEHQKSTRISLNDGIAALKIAMQAKQNAFRKI